MGRTDDFILGNGAVHDRFFATAEILARLVTSAPQAVSLLQLEEATGRPARELTRLCASLARAKLLRTDAREADKWTLACSPSVLTLEDVFRCVLDAQPSRARPCARRLTPERGRGDVDLLVTQAMIAVNQSVFKHLRQFSLDRLKISAAGMFPAPRRVLRDPDLDGAFDLTLSGRESGHAPAEQVAVQAPI